MKLYSLLCPKYGTRIFDCDVPGRILKYFPTFSTQAALFNALYEPLFERLMVWSARLGDVGYAFDARYVELLTAQLRHARVDADAAGVFGELLRLRRQRFWENERHKLREALARLIDDVTRRAAYAACPH
jgi:hypothetical protein